MLNKFDLKNDRRGQVASTTTWIVATLIIIVILLIFFYASSALAIATERVDLEQFVSSMSFVEKDSLLVTKTATAYLLTPENKRAGVDLWLNEKEVDLGDYIQ